jgi:hypothetical protein
MPFTRQLKILIEKMKEFIKKIDTVQLKTIIQKSH